MDIKIPVIDLFAGPGGLSEGFSAFPGIGKRARFKISLSIEKDQIAYHTLELRAFYRSLVTDLARVPEAYHKYLRREITRDDLFKSKICLEAACKAEQEAWNAELGVTCQKEVDTRIKQALGNSKIWVLIGGPPCQAYSIIGRSRMRRTHGEIFKNDKRHFLYEKY